ncbi:glycosyltransferase [Cellulomonas soli]
MFLDPIPDYVDDLTDLVASFAPHVVLTESAFVAGAMAAARHDLPCVALSVIPLALTSRDTAPFGTGLAPSSGVVGRVRNAALRLVVEKVVFRDAQRVARTMMAELGMAHPRGFLLDWVSQLATRTLHASVPGLEHPRSDLPASVELIGPILPREVERFERPVWWSDLLEACTARRPVVLVTQGTVATDPQRLVLPAIAGLAHEDVLVVATTPGAADGSGVAEADVPANARVTDFVPFDQPAAVRRRAGHQRRVRRGPAGPGARRAGGGGRAHGGQGGGRRARGAGRCRCAGADRPAHRCRVRCRCAGGGPGGARLTADRCAGACPGRRVRALRRGGPRRRGRRDHRAAARALARGRRGGGAQRRAA